MQMAIDPGGTLTDCVNLQAGRGKILKILPTPEDPGRAVIHAIPAVFANGSLLVKHGTTVGTNALLERKGARVAFVTTAGFEDSIAIGRQARRSLYDWFATPPPSIVTKELRFGGPEPTAADGTVLRKPTPAELEQLAACAESSRFDVHEDEVYDRRTSLQRLRCSVGQQCKGEKIKTVSKVQRLRSASAGAGILTVGVSTLITLGVHPW